MAINKWLVYLILMLSIDSCKQSNTCLITNEFILRSQINKVFQIDNHDGFPNDICDRGTDSINMIGYYSF